MTITEFPSLVDCHVHFREPGLEHKGDMRSEASAAHAGGIDVVCDMPNTMPPTQSIAAFADKVRRAEAVRSLCDIRFFFGATALRHLSELESLWTDPLHASLKARCAGLKLYLDNSTGDLKSSAEVTAAGFALCGRLGITLVAHCEHAAHNDAAAVRHPYTGPSSHSLRRPAHSEAASIADAIALARQYGTKLHIAHLSTGEGLEHVRRARVEGLHVTAEVTPHHLFLTTEDYPCCGARMKVNPPIRSPRHHEQLWEGVLDGTVDCIGTDHAPHSLEEKANAENPPSGMPAVELVVPLLLTVCAGKWPHPTAPKPKALESGRLTLADIVRLMHTNPNRIFNLGLSDAKSRTFDTDVEWIVDEEKLASKCRWSPYANWRLIGKALIK